MTIFVISVGAGYGKYSLPLIQELAKHNGAGLHVVTENPHPLHPSWIKCLCHKIVEDDFILCWDLDLIPQSLYCLAEYLDVTRINMAEDFIFSKHSGPVFNENFKYNGGLIGIPKSESDFFEDIFYNHDKSKLYPSYEQYHLNDQIAEMQKSIHELPLELNCAKKWNGEPQDISRALNIHYTYGYTEIEKFDEIKNEFFSKKVLTGV